MSYQQVFLSSFFGGLGLGLAAIISIYLASVLDKAEGAIKELWGIRRDMKRNPAKGEHLEAGAKMPANILPGVPPGSIAPHDPAMVSGALNLEVKKKQCNCEPGCQECCGSVSFEKTP